MAKRFTRHYAVRWAFLFLFVATTLGQIVEDISTEGSFVDDVTTEYPETTTEYQETTTEYPETTTEYPETTTETFLEITESTDTQRSERMVAVYVKPDPKAETRNISDFLDYGDVILETGDKETVVISDSEEDEYEEGSDGDIMTMAARSLKQNLTEDQLAAEAGTFESAKQPLLKGNDLKEMLYKWNREFDFNLTDLYKINLASVFAREYDEMDKLMKENLVEDTDEFARSMVMKEGLEPRDLDNPVLDMAVDATEEVMSTQVLPPPTATARPLYTQQVRTSTPQRVPALHYTYQGRTPPMLQPFPGQPMYHRSDTGSSYILLPKPPQQAIKPRPGLYRTVTGQPMIIHSDGPAARLPMRQSTAPPRIRRPQNQPTTTPPGVRFGERFASRLPRPFQRILNMTMGSRQTTTEAPNYSSVLHLPAPSVSHPTRVRAPYYFQQATQNSIPTPRNRLPVPVAATTPRSRSTITKEFGIRIRPSRVESQRNPKIKEETKEQRDVKISQLRSNLVGKLVVIQSMLDDKEKSGKPVEMNSRRPTISFNRNGLPSGLLKPIVPLRPRLNVASATTPVTATEALVEQLTTESLLRNVWKDNKKYRRPPSFKKEQHKVKAHFQIESTLDSTTVELLNTTEKSVLDYELNSTRPADIIGSTEPPISTDSEDTTASSVESSSSPVDSVAATPRSSTDAKYESAATNTPTSVPSIESTLVIFNATETTKQPSTEPRNNNDEAVASRPMASLSETATEKEMSYADTLITPRPVVAPQTVKTLTETTSTDEQTNRQHTKIATETVENAAETQAPSDTEINTAPQIVDTVFAINSTENPAVEDDTEIGHSNTFAPENDPYLKAMIERALQLSQEDDLEKIQGTIPEEDDPLKYLEKGPRDYFRDLIRETEDDHPKEDGVPEYPAEFPEDNFRALQGETQANPLKEDDRLTADLRKNSEGDFLREDDKPEDASPNTRYLKEDDGIEDGSEWNPFDDEIDPVNNEDEGLSHDASVLSRVDRSAENSQKMMDNLEETAVVELARGARPFNLPHNILPDEVHEARPAEDERKGIRSEMQSRRDVVTIPLTSYQAPEQRPFARFITNLYSRFKS